MCFQLSITTLNRYIKKLEKDTTALYTSYAKPGRTFNIGEEKALVELILEASEIFFWLTRTEIRRFAVQFASKKNITCPSQWSANESAGEEWVAGFLQRNKELQTRSAEHNKAFTTDNCFDRINVELYYDRLREVLEKYQFRSNDIYNCDEVEVSALSSLADSDVVDVTKQKVSVCLSVSAYGGCVPPMLVFPRVHYRDHYIHNGPDQCIGSANEEGVMKEKDFIIYLTHFQNFVKCSKKCPVLLLLDNDRSHVSLPAMEFCKRNGIHLLSFPAHAQRKLQPVHYGIFDVLRDYLSTTIDQWQRNNPSKALDIYDVPAILSESLPPSLTPVNIRNGFKNAGVHPFNRELFRPQDFKSCRYCPGYIKPAVKRKPTTPFRVVPKCFGLTPNATGDPKDESRDRLMPGPTTEASSEHTGSSSTMTKQQIDQIVNGLNHDVQQKPLQLHDNMALQSLHSTMLAGQNTYNSEPTTSSPAGVWTQFPNNVALPEPHGHPLEQALAHHPEPIPTSSGMAVVPTLTTVPMPVTNVIHEPPRKRAVHEEDQVCPTCGDTLLNATGANNKRCIMWSRCPVCHEWSHCIMSHAGDPNICHSRLAASQIWGM